MDVVVVVVVVAEFHLDSECFFSLGIVCTLIGPSYM